MPAPQMLFLWFADGVSAGVHTVPAGTFNDQNPYPPHVAIVYEMVELAVIFTQDPRQADRYQSFQPCPYPKPD
jgi:hypothetical protein